MPDTGSCPVAQFVRSAHLSQHSLYCRHISNPFTKDSRQRDRDILFDWLSYCLITSPGFEPESPCEYYHSVFTFSFQNMYMCTCMCLYICMCMYIHMYSSWLGLLKAQSFTITIQVSFTVSNTWILVCTCFQNNCKILVTSNSDQSFPIHWISWSAK